MNETRYLSKFIYQLSYEDLPSEVIEKCKTMVMDTIGCAIAVGKIDKQKEKIALNIARQFNTKPDATVIKGGFKSHFFYAAMANSLLSHSLDYDDTNKKSLIHTGAILVPTGLAIAESEKRTGKEFITSIVAGYEACVRIGMCVMPSHYNFWHSTATNGTFGSGTVAAKIMDLNVNQIQNCLGMCGTQAAGLVTFFEYGDYTKTLHAGKASLNGILSAFLSKMDATAPPTILEHEKGFSSAFSENPQLEKITDGLGTKWEILNNAIKPYPSILASHSAIEATLNCIQDNNISYHDIYKIVLRTYDTVVTHFSNYNIGESSMAARLSVPYCIAIAAIDGVVGNEQFTFQRIKSNEIINMLKKVEIVSDPNLTRMYPKKFPAAVSIITKNGRKFEETVHYSKGDNNNPIALKEIENKFSLNAKDRLTSEQIITFLDKIHNLENLASLDEIGNIIN